VTENKHWLSDTLAGGVLGYIIGRLVIRNHRSRYPTTPPAGLPQGSPNLALSFSF
jgi:hypothetical protein